MTKVLARGLFKGFVVVSLSLLMAMASYILGTIIYRTNGEAVIAVLVSIAMILIWGQAGVTTDEWRAE